MNKQHILTIDTGTTNTRVTLWDGDKPLRMIKTAVGVRDVAIANDKQILVKAIRNSFYSLLPKTERPQALILASGMLTSDAGLVSIPHISAPAGILELSYAMVSLPIPGLTEVPIWFIPGVKNNVVNVSIHNIAKADVMRGEEVEAIGYIQEAQEQEPEILILPGSHTKFIWLDQARIQHSATSMTGELLDLLTKKSLLTDSVNGNFANQIDLSMVKHGADMADICGLGQAVFSVRLLDLLAQTTVDQRASFLLGAVLQSDIKALLAIQKKSIPIRILGKPSLANPLKMLLMQKKEIASDIRCIDSANFAGIGALAIAKKRGLIKEGGK